MNRDVRILTEIGNLLYKEKNKKIIENEFKNNLFPLKLIASKGSLLNQGTIDYLNSLSHKNLKGCTSSSNTFVSNPNIKYTLLNLKYNEEKEATNKNNRNI